MDKKMYIIKCTYDDEECPYNGHEFYMKKGGYVVDPTFVWEEDAYDTLTYAKSVCKRYAEDNERDVIDDIWMREHCKLINYTRVSYRIKYEPYKVIAMHF